MADAPDGNRVQYRFLDGMRGIAAVTVVLLHTYLYTGLEGEAQTGLPEILRIFPVVGTFGVPTFIVLAGFVLTLPIARHSELRLPRSLWSYVKRRARRILPPYYASLALCLVLIWSIPSMSSDLGTAWDTKVPVTSDGLVAHLLLIHNLHAAWALQINGPAWSIATEWQLYFTLPLLILPIWRRFGRVPMLLSVTLLGFGITAVFPTTAAGGLWYISLFALGALAADVCVAGHHIPMLVPGTVVAWLAATGAAVVAEARAGLPGSSLLSIGAACLVGLAVALLVIQLTRAERGFFVVVRRLLDSTGLVWLGLWSYSLYLVHSPLLALGNVLLMDIEISTTQRFLIQFLIVMPLSALTAYLFHRVVERRFLTGHQRDLQRAVSINDGRLRK